ncbi:uncharacterized protein LOC129613708 [Condylostylus longicornis]|uniref:uncharacterized protein LOC129613708 n=1 Tax=Condylostylus longicornis TaxID=2530218 RepID=UPI00244DCA7A|nr:uncharacterized protein LOC129613708 [Condylostylus longicornis]
MTTGGGLEFFVTLPRLLESGTSAFSAFPRSDDKKKVDYRMKNKESGLKRAKIWSTTKYMRKIEKCFASINKKHIASNTQGSAKSKNIEKKYVHFQAPQGVWFEFRPLTVSITRTSGAEFISRQIKRATAAWSTLRNRFDNKRVLVNTQLQILLNQNTTSHESAAGIRKLLDITNECLQALTNMMVEVEEWDPILVYLTVQKLPSETHQLWEQSIGCSKSIPSLGELAQFLETKFRTLEANSTKKGQNCQDQKKNCSGHRFSTCQSKSKCRFCNKNHHTLLHRTYETSRDFQPLSMHGRPRNNGNIPGTSSNGGSSRADQISPIQNDLQFQTYSINTTNQSSQILLATQLVKIINPISGRCQVARALIDPGSQTSFVSETLAQQIGLKRKEICAQIHIVGQTSIAQIKFSAKFFLGTLSHSDLEQIEVTGLLLQKLTHMIPEKVVIRDDSVVIRMHLRRLKLADPEYYIPSKVDLLLGADVYGRILLNGAEKGPVGIPIAQRTIFGWILSGEVQESSHTTNFISNFYKYGNLNEELKKYWEIEKISTKKLLTLEEEQCELRFMRTHTRLSKGKYMVELPLRPESDETSFEKTRNVAVSRLLAMERRFKNDEGLKNNYKKCVQEYLDLDEMGSSYLPHHGVVKKSNTTTKLRGVFDASRPTSTGVSLNDKMFKGPVLQDELASLLIRWRINKIAFTADLEKMYRQIYVSPKHGITSNNRAVDEGHRLSVAAEIILSCFYVDDLLSGSDDIKTGLTIQKQLIELMRAGGFILRKWASNSQDLLNAVPKEHREINFPLNTSEDETIRVLGIQWNPSTDRFVYTTNEYVSNYNVDKKKGSI